MIKRVKGTQDILNKAPYNSLITHLSERLIKSGYTEIETPVLEQLALFTHSVGTETDIVTKEMYTLSPNNKDSFCLRPEGTAATMRAFLENKIDQTPWQVWSHGPMFRHERPQKGRWRQFSQCNIESIGITDISSDAQFIYMLDQIFSNQLKLTNYILEINYLGDKADRANHRSALARFLDAIESKICETCQIRKEKNILRVFDCKNETCKSLYLDAPRITDYISESSQKEWEQFQFYLEALSVKWVHNSQLVRGLDYYNKTVFEFSSNNLGAQNAFCGGGRYELAQILGHKTEVPSIGAAIGIERLLLLLESTENSVLDTKQKQSLLIAPLEEKYIPLALWGYQKTSEHNLPGIYTGPGKLKKILKRADKENINFVIFIGDEEAESSTVALKNMETGETDKIKQEVFVERLKSLGF